MGKMPRPRGTGVPPVGNHRVILNKSIYYTFIYLISFHRALDIQITLLISMRNRGTRLPSLSSANAPRRRDASSIPSASTKPIHVRQGANLPHWTREGGTYAVTLRLFDSLPAQLLEGWKRELAELLQNAKDRKNGLAEDELARWAFLRSERVEQYLDAGYGSCWLRRPDVAQMVANAFQHFTGSRYEMLAWCIMPNHAHLVFTPAGEWTLSQILHSWNSYTSKEANKLLGRTGGFWQTEPYDHLIRDADDLRHAISYVLKNPREAGLKNWSWVWAKPDLAVG